MTDDCSTFPEKTSDSSHCLTISWPVCVLLQRSEKSSHFGEKRRSWIIRGKLLISPMFFNTGWHVRQGEAVLFERFATKWRIRHSYKAILQSAEAQWMVLERFIVLVLPGMPYRPKS